MTRSAGFLQTYLVVLLWSASPPLVKIVMQHLSPGQVAGLRYTLGFLVLLPWVLKKSLPALRKLTRMQWLGLVLMGVLAYPIGNVLLFWGLQTLPATTTAFTLNAIPLFTLLIGILWLKETPTRVQFLGMVVALAGGLYYFGLRIDPADHRALLASLVAALAMAVFSVMGRYYARNGLLDAFALTALPLGFGGIPLLFFAPLHSVPPAATIGVVIWLGVINSGLAYLLLNLARRTLQAYETGFITNLMPIGTGLIAPLLIGEQVSGQSWTGMVIAIAGVLLVSAGGRRAIPSPCG